MTRVHYRVEVLYETLDGPACGYQARGRLTEDHTKVDCPECLSLMGIEATEPEQLTVCEPDPIARAA